jgi:hypothetical protein
MGRRRVLLPEERLFKCTRSSCVGRVEMDFLCLVVLDYQSCTLVGNKFMSCIGEQYNILKCSLEVGCCT